MKLLCILLSLHNKPYYLEKDRQLRFFIYKLFVGFGGVKIFGLDYHYIHSKPHGRVKLIFGPLSKWNYYVFDYHYIVNLMEG